MDKDIIAKDKGRVAMYLWPHFGKMSYIPGILLLSINTQILQKEKKKQSKKSVLELTKK